MASGDTKTESYLRTAAEGTRADLPSDNCCNTKTQNLIVGVAERIMDVEDEVEELKNNPDVVDIVDTYQDLQDYDTSTLTDKDIIRVLQDSTHSGNSTYYRWNATTNQFDFVGEIAGGGGVTPVQTTGTSTTDVMSQNATSSMVFADPGTDSKIKIGSNTRADSDLSVVVGRSATDVGGYYNTLVGASTHAGVNRSSIVAVGFQANVNADNSVAIGRATKINQTSNQSSVALGAWAEPTRKGEVNIGAGTSGEGYNSTNYRVLGGVHDPVDAHDAATKGYVDANAGGVKTLTSADYNFPSNNPSVIAPWLLPVGQYIVESQTNIMPDGNSSTYFASERIGLVVITQATDQGNTYGAFIFSLNTESKFYKVQYNGTPVSGFPHDI